jgi:hypothetical protein
MSNEWAHDAARKGVPTEMINFSHDGHVLAGSAGACFPGAVPAQLVQDRGHVARVGQAKYVQTLVTRPRTLQKNPFMTRGAVISGASSGPPRAWDPV